MEASLDYMRTCLQNNQTNKQKEEKQTGSKLVASAARALGHDIQLRQGYLTAFSLCHPDLAHSLEDAPSHLHLESFDLQHLLLDTHPIGCLPSGPSGSQDPGLHGFSKDVAVE